MFLIIKYISDSRAAPPEAAQLNLNYKCWIVTRFLYIDIKIRELIGELKTEDYLLGNVKSRIETYTILNIFTN